MYTEAVMQIISIIGVVAFALSGAMTAMEKHSDPFGTVTLAVLTAVGGGIIRDVLLGLLPPQIFRDYTFVLIAIIVALIAFLAAYIAKDTYRRKSAVMESVNNVFDALGLGVFAVTGVQTAIDYGFSQNGFFAVFIGMITAIGGGFLRDITVCEIPFVLKKHIYALAALAGSLSYYLLYINGFSYTISAFISASLTFLLRIAATRFHWNLPAAY